MVTRLSARMHFGICLAILLIVVGLIPDDAHGQLLERTIEKRDPNDISALLKPGYRYRQPAGDGPFPTVLLVSGCDGPKDNMQMWAGVFADLGWASVMVDSHTPRGYDEYQLWRVICVGQLLPGAQRAGDLAVALADVAKMPFVDPDRLMLFGASHGGWSILELMALEKEGRPPYGLTRWPDGPRPKDLAGAIVLYPYCGRLSRVSSSGWSADIPVQAILVEDDLITDEKPCIELFDRMRADGRPLHYVMIRGATHGFDQTDKSFFSPLEFSKDATRAAIDTVTRFVSGL